MKIVCIQPSVIDPVILAAGLPLPPVDTPLTNPVLIGQLTGAVPVPAPAVGFVYTIDPVTGIATRSRDSLGPIMAERGQTIGSRRFQFGFSYQHFTFDEVDGVDIHNASSVIYPFRNDLNFSMSLSQYTTYFTYGLTDRIDVSLVLPFNSVKMGLAWRGTPVPGVPGPPLPTLTASGTRTASGIGDMTVQVKGSLIRGERGALAAGLAVRTPTGDEYNALGAGAVGIRPFFAGSYTYGRISPHANIGYEWNGKSIIVGSVLTGEERSIPKQIPYAVGFDARIHNSVTFAFDVLGRQMINADRVITANTPTPTGNVTANTFIRESFNITNGSVGFKLNPVGGLLLNLNLLFRMNSGGLRTKVAPLFGLSYTL